MGTLELSKKSVTNQELRILKGKNKYFKERYKAVDLEAWAVQIKDKAFEKYNDCHFIKKYKGVLIYDVDVKVAAHYETIDSRTMHVTVRVYKNNNGETEFFRARIKG